MKREEAMQLAEQGIAALNEALQAGHSETLDHFLAMLARFHQYSFRNALLIAVQNPDATHVAGFHKWKKLKRAVKKGERGIAILAPMVTREREEQRASQHGDYESNLVRGFKVAYVFDVSQTEGEPLPEFAQVMGDPHDWLIHLQGLIREAGVILEYESLPNGTLGCSTPGMIRVRPGLAANQEFAVLVHEFAHELLHQRLGRIHNIAKSVRETEAEAVAYTVCRACGIDSTAQSADYIQLYQGNADTLRESLEFVQNAATEIISAIRSKHDDLNQPVTTTLAA